MFFLSKSPFSIKIKKTFGFYPKNQSLYELAFKHRSVSNPYQVNNERLEFVGDSVLSLIITDLLYTIFPEGKEGYLSQFRSKIINRVYLNNLAIKLGIDKFLKYDKSIQPEKNSLVIDIFGNALEALIGAIYFDRGYKFVREFIIKEIWEKYINIEEIGSLEMNYKGRLYEYIQSEGREIKFIVEEIKNPEGIIYSAKVFIDGIEYGTGKGAKKKTAEQQASQIAYNKIFS